MKKSKKQRDRPSGGRARRWLRRYRWPVAGGAALLAVLIAVLLFILPAQGEDEDFQLLQRSIQNTESLPAYRATVQATNQLKDGTSTDQMTISGIIQRKKEPEKAIYALETTGQYQSNPANDYRVQTILFSDGNGVYEKVGNQTRPAEVTPEEFRELGETVRLFHIDPGQINTSNVSVSEQQGGSSSFVYTLKHLDKELLETHAALYRQLAGEGVKVETSDIALLKAQVTYIVENEKILSQNLQFTTQYRRDNHDYVYSSLAEVNFVDTEADYDFELPDLPQGETQDEV